MMDPKCPACAYALGAPPWAITLGAAIAGREIVSDAIAVGVGAGLAIAKLSPRQQRRVLGALCLAHKRDMRSVSTDLFTPKKPL